MPPGETQASLFQRGSELPEYLIRGHKLDPARINLLAAPPHFLQPSGLDIGVGGAIQFLPKKSKQSFLLWSAKCPNFFVNFRERACHERQAIRADQLKQQGC